MSKTNSDQSLFLAKTEYTGILCDLFTTPVYSIMQNEWTTALVRYNELQLANNNTKSPLMVFQDKMREIPNWSSDRINREYKNSLERHTTTSYYKTLLETVFVVNVQLFSQFQKIKGQLKISIPEERKFFHLVVIECARQFFQNPCVIRPSLNCITANTNLRTAMEMIKQSVCRVVERALPIDTIIRSSRPQVQTEVLEEIPEENPEEIPEEIPEDYTEEDTPNTQTNDEIEELTGLQKHTDSEQTGAEEPVASTEPVEPAEPAEPTEPMEVDDLPEEDYDVKSVPEYKPDSSDEVQRMKIRV